MNKIKRFDERKVKQTIPIENNINIMKYLSDMNIKSYKENKKRLTQSLENEFEILFGKCHGTLRGEYYHRFWNVSFENLIFKIYTAKGKGTTSEIEGFDFKNINDLYALNKTLIEFLDELHQMINS